MATFKKGPHKGRRLQQISGVFFLKKNMEFPWKKMEQMGFYMKQIGFIYGFI